MEEAFLFILILAFISVLLGMLDTLYDYIIDKRKKSKRIKSLSKEDKSYVSDLTREERKELDAYIKSVKGVETEEEDYKNTNTQSSIDIRLDEPHFKSWKLSINPTTDYVNRQSNRTYSEYKAYFTNAVKELSIKELQSLIKRSEKILLKNSKKLHKVKRVEEYADIKLMEETHIECAKEELKRKEDYLFNMQKPRTEIFDYKSAYQIMINDITNSINRKSRK